MATLEQRGSWFRVIFVMGASATQTLNTTDAGMARSLKGGIEKTIMLLQQHLLQLPVGMDPVAFIVSGGQLPEAQEKVPYDPPLDRLQTLQRLCDRYAQTLAVSVEENSLATVKMHLRHICRFLTG